MGEPLKASVSRTYGLSFRRSCLLAGTWVNLVLFTIEITLFGYFMPQWQLNPAYKYGFYILITNDALATFVVCLNLFLTIVDGPSNGVTWPIAILLLSTGFSAFMEQTFLIVSGAKSVSMSAFLMLIVVAHLALTVTATVYGSPGSTLEFKSKIGPNRCRDYAPPPTVLIALSIVWSLSGIRPVWRSTQQYALLSWVISPAPSLPTPDSSACSASTRSPPASIVASVTLLSMVTELLKDVNGIIFSLFFASMGRVYSITVLVNIIVRNSQRDVVNTVHVSELSLSTMPAMPVPGPGFRHLDHSRADSNAAERRTYYSAAAAADGGSQSKTTLPLDVPNPHGSLRLSLPEHQSHPRTPYTQSPADHTTTEFNFVFDQQHASHDRKPPDSPPLG
ncbi:hypothetical protein DFH09DRAFT_1143851 [Mycena vulgaris]|nr:hypothetical protein DFH09DRAFT_1143851 [Mycena vulgaris]